MMLTPTASRSPASFRRTRQGATAAPRSPARRRRALESLPASRRRPEPRPRSRGAGGRARGIACEVPGPGTMAEDNGRMAAGLVRWCERASTRGAVPRTWKKLPVTSEPSNLRPSIRTSMSGALREGIGEQARLADERFKLLAREALGFRVRRSLTFDREELARVAHFVRAKDQRVEERKHDGHQPKAERYRRHDCQGRQRRLAERAERVSEVSDHAVERHLKIHGPSSMTVSLPRQFDFFGATGDRQTPRRRRDFLPGPPGATISTDILGNGKGWRCRQSPISSHQVA